MKIIKKALKHLFIDGLGAMALGLFATLLVGTILEQVGKLFPGQAGAYIIVIATVAKKLTGFGIGVAVASKFKKAPLVTVSAGVAGMVGAFASPIINGTLMADGIFALAGVGEPLGAFVASYVAVVIGGLVSGKTKIDILVSPIVTIAVGAAAGLLVGVPIAAFMTKVGALINWGAEQQPFIAGILVSVLMGIALTLPISSAAIGVSLGLSGIAAGAAAVGCCANMIGFAVASFRENKVGGLVAQGLGTSMLQMPNIVKRPQIWIPAILTSAILGPISTCVLGMVNNPTGSGMGTCGIVGPLMGFQAMTEAGVAPVAAIVQIVIMHFIAPAVLSLIFSEAMRKLKWIKYGDMKLHT
ncbi:MAG: PTS sugar transporter subunit IIC [Oscillospiraceae bacterium]|nr:PTS sugar transporter subunit IIC [Oscillospiraceae bacterium]